MRLIDADALIEKCNEDMEAVKDLPQRQDGILDAIMNIDECPTIEPKIKCVSNVTLTDEQVKEAFEKAKCEILASQPEIIRCKDCKHRILNENYGKNGYINIKAMCELDTGDPFELGRYAEDDDWYCADAERRTDE